MKLIDQSLSNGFIRLRAAAGSDAEVARILGTSRAHIGRILKGVTKFIEDDTWTRIEPILSRYITPSSPVSNAEPVREAIATYPVISEAAAVEGSGCAYVPMSDWATEYAEDTVSFSEGRPGDFVIRVTGDSMLPWYPSGTLVLVRPNMRISNGERVVAVLDDGSVVFKVFAEKGEYIHLFSVNQGDGRDFHLLKKDSRGIRIYPVIQSMRDERKLDRAMDAKGVKHFWQEKLEQL